MVLIENKEIKTEGYPTLTSEDVQNKAMTTTLRKKSSPKPN